MGTQNEFSDQQHPSDDVRVENCKRDTGENGGSDAEGDPKRPQIDGEIASPSKAGAHQAPIGDTEPAPAVVDTEADEKLSIQQPEGLETLLEAEPLGAVAMEEDLPTSHKRSPAPEGEPAAGNGPGSSNKGDPGQAIAPAGKNDGPGPGAASNPSQSRIYAEALQSLRDSIAFEETADCVPSWDAFPNHLGEGVRARLLSLATLHLSSGDVAAAVPAAVKQLPSNSNKVLFGAPTNCDLYQVRIIRALAHKVGARLLVVDSSTLHLCEDSQDSSQGGGAGSGEDIDKGATHFIYDSPSDDDLEDPGYPIYGLLSDEDLQKEAGKEEKDIASHPSHDDQSPHYREGRKKIKRGAPRSGLPSFMIGGPPGPGMARRGGLGVSGGFARRGGGHAGRRPGSAAAGGSGKEDQSEVEKAVAAAAAAVALAEEEEARKKKQQEKKLLKGEEAKNEEVKAKAKAKKEQQGEDGFEDVNMALDEPDIDGAAAAVTGEAAGLQNQATATDSPAAVAGAVTTEKAVNDGEKGRELNATMVLLREAYPGVPEELLERYKSSMDMLSVLFPPPPAAAAAADPQKGGVVPASRSPDKIKKAGGKGKDKAKGDDLGDDKAKQAKDQEDAVDKAAADKDREKGEALGGVKPALEANRKQLEKKNRDERLEQKSREMADRHAKNMKKLAENTKKAQAENKKLVNAIHDRITAASIPDTSKLRLGSGLKVFPEEKPAAAAVGKAPSSFKVGDRVMYVGKVHPRVKGNLDALHQAIARVESRQAQSRLGDVLPALLARRTATLAAMSSSRAPRVLSDTPTPPINSKGRVLAIPTTGSDAGKIKVIFDQPFAGALTFPPSEATAKVAHEGEVVIYSLNKRGLICDGAELQKVEDKEDGWLAAMEALFTVIKEEEAAKGPLIVLVKNMDRMVKLEAVDHIKSLESHLSTLPSNTLIFSAFCTRALSRDSPKGGMGGSMSLLFSGRGGGGGGDAFASMGEESSQPWWFDPFNRRAISGKHRRSTKGKMMMKLFPNTLDLHPPNHDNLAKAWRVMLEADVASMRETANRAALKKALERCGLGCDELEDVKIKEGALSREEVEQVICGAVTELLNEGPPPASAIAAIIGGGYLPDVPALEGGNAVEEKVVEVTVNGSTPAGEEEPAAAAMEGVTSAAPSTDALVAGEDQQPTEEAEGFVEGQALPPATAAAAEPNNNKKAETKLILKARHIMTAAEIIRKMQEEAGPVVERAALKDVQADQYEKQLLSEVIPPEEIAVTFDNIGALDGVKDTLFEVVILPLQRPELFTRGALTKPTKGLLMFGPPGTGKTMLAKAVASESGAHFINVNMSALTSKWFGEGERLVRALFSLAHKLSPSVIFIDEIDSFLSKRSNSGNEHEALRKMKNEFMQHWDGLRTKAHDRVLVLGATNRPMDLDDAVIRRMPRRIFVPLPDAANRERILKVILKDEALDPNLDFAELAKLADGYSGSDLKNLCIAAAYFPIRELLAAEKEKRYPKKDTAAVHPAKRQKVEQQQDGPTPKEPSPAGGTTASTSSNDNGSIRLITFADFEAAMKQVTASTHAESATMGELQRWNEQFGEGGSRKVEKLAYYT